VGNKQSLLNTSGGNFRVNLKFYLRSHMKISSALFVDQSNDDLKLATALMLKR